MRVEACCTALLKAMLPAIDPQRQGHCIDVGVGTFAFYCDLFAQLGFPTVAVEPVPIPKLRQLCQRRQIQLMEVCLSDQTGTQPFYGGQFARLGNKNFNSLAPDWFGSSAQSQLINTLSLGDFLEAIAPPQITCLKLDIEGWEPVVLKQWADLPTPLLPKVTMFEYGGGTDRQAGEKGWSPKFLSGTLQCLETLKQCGYGLSIRVDYAHGTLPHLFDLQTTTPTPALFPPTAVYGNIISLHNCHYSPEAIARIGQRYRGGIINWLVNQWVST
jgi:FkbM family methyltransferase